MSLVGTDLTEVDTSTLAGPDALALHACLVRERRALQAFEARVAARVVETFAFRATGIEDATDWLARASGCGLGEAQAVIRTMTRVQATPATAVALARGEISIAQADEITVTARIVPAAEASMLAAAKEGVAMKKLREEGLERRSRATHPDDLQRQRRARRSFRRWTDRHGMRRGSYSLTPEEEQPFASRVDAECDRLYRSRTTGDDSTKEQRAADAFLTVCATGGKPNATRRDVVIVAGVSTLRSGAFVDGEPCHVLGTEGPVTIAPKVARSFLDGGDCFVSLVLHNGVEITHVRRHGRKITAELRLAIGLGPPPLFHGEECGCGCGKRLGLQRDHLVPVAAGGQTSLENVKTKCGPSHRAKTEAERAAGLYRRPDRAPPRRPAA